MDMERGKPPNILSRIEPTAAAGINDKPRQESAEMKHFAVATALAWLAMSCGPLATPVAAGQVEQKRFTAKSYPGSRDRDYKVFVPASYTGQTPVPMVMVLHGCSQTEQNMLAETRFMELAERDGFIAVYPFITSFDGLRAPKG